MAWSSFRPMRRLTISSFPAFVSKRQTGPSGTRGIGNGKSSGPTKSTTFPPPPSRR